MGTLPVAAQCDPFVDPNCQDPDTDVPLDDHLVYLMGGGLVIGFIYLRKRTFGDNISE